MSEEYGSDLCCETKFIAMFIRVVQKKLFFSNLTHQPRKLLGW